MPNPTRGLDEHVALVDESGNPLATAAGMTADTELPAAAAVSATGDTRAAAMPEIASIQLIYDAGADKVVMVRTAKDFTDAAAGGTIAPAGLVLYRGDATWERQRTPVVFKVVALTAGTSETTIWTPANGTKFRLMGFCLTCGAASTLTFKDNTAGTTIFAARGTTDQPIVVNLGNGILSGAVNRVLTVTRGTSATLDGVVWGTEES